MIPNIIWRYWDQGWENAPSIVQLCTKSVYTHASYDFEIRNLDRYSLKEYLNIDSYVSNIDIYPIQMKADLIRVLLLEKYGGIWMDATVFLTKKLKDFIKKITCDFFCFYWWENHQGVSNWFLVSNPHSYVIKTFIDEYIKIFTSEDFLSKNKSYFNKWRGSPNYFIFHTIFQNLYKTDKLFNDEINKMPFISSVNAHIPWLEYGINHDLCLDEKERILNDTTLLKFNHLFNDKINKNSILNYLSDTINGTTEYKNPFIISYYAIRGITYYNEYINNPDKLSFCGAVASIKDLKICNENYPFYYIFNFQSPKNHIVQLLLTNKDNRLFIRHQQGKKFTSAREVAYMDQISKLELRIKKLEEESNENFWKTSLRGIQEYIIYNVIYSFDIKKSYYQIYIKDINKKIHYELLRTQDQNKVIVALHLEDSQYNNLANEIFTHIQNIHKDKYKISCKSPKFSIEKLSSTELYLEELQLLMKLSYNKLRERERERERERLKSAG